MAMICPDCQQNLDDVPVGDPCPQCGGVQRSAVVQGPGRHGRRISPERSRFRSATAWTPGWAYQWVGTIQRLLARLREHYQGIDNR